MKIIKIVLNNALKKQFSKLNSTIKDESELKEMLKKDEEGNNNNFYTLNDSKAIKSTK